MTRAAVGGGGGGGVEEGSGPTWGGGGGGRGGRMWAHLVLHERHEGRDDESDAVGALAVEEGRQLVAQRLTGTGRQDQQS